MIQRVLPLFFCGIFLCSCQFYQKKKIDDDAIVDTIIDFKSVDVFPLFPSCDSIPSLDKQRICSQIKLSEHVYALLSSAQIMASKKVQDTIYIKLLVSAKGKVSMTDLRTSEFLKNQIPKLDSLIEDGVSKLPIMKPAIKRGMPVATEFSLPIIVVN